MRITIDISDTGAHAPQISSSDSATTTAGAGQSGAASEAAAASDRTAMAINAGPAPVRAATTGTAATSGEQRVTQLLLEASADGQAQSAGAAPQLP